MVYSFTTLFPSIFAEDTGELMPEGALTSLTVFDEFRYFSGQAGTVIDVTK